MGRPLGFTKKLTNQYNTHAKDVDEAATKAQMEFVNGQTADLKQMAEAAGISWPAVIKNIGPAAIAAGAGEYVPELGKAMAYWYWSTASSIAHAEQGNTRELADLRFIGVDVRDSPIAYAEPSAATIWKHLEAAIHMIDSAHQLWNLRAR